MSAIVVHDQVNAQTWIFGKLLGQRRVNLLQEFDELLLTVATVTLANDFASGHSQGCEERCRAMAFIIVGVSLSLSRPQRQQGLSAIQSLDLRFFIDAQDDGLIGRIQIQANPIANLFDKERIGGQLECIRAVWLEAKSAPDTPNGLAREPCGIGHATRAPVGGGLRLALQGLRDDLFDAGIGDRPGGSRAWLARNARRAALADA